MCDVSLIINCILILCFVFLGFVFLKEKQSKKQNLALFYSTLWIVFSLVIVNYICVELDFWSFIPEEDLIINMPYDLFFIWIIFWGVLPFYFLKGKYALVLSLLLFWIDLILMPKLEEFGLLALNEYWIVGEVFLIIFVFLPSYLWAKFSLENKYLKFRAVFQIVIMTVFLFVIIPFIVLIYSKNNFEFELISPLLFQIILIIAFPSLMAVIDLVEKGKGTPFPLDATKRMVETGVYAYCKNPIQWSFTLLFIPLAIHYNSYLLSFGFFISLAYVIGVSNPQEYLDMNSRFDIKWDLYKKNVPSWWFLWKPKFIPKGILYFKKDCNQCEQIKQWFEKRQAINLDIRYSKEYNSSELLQATYVHPSGLKFSSVKAIAHGVEHINLAWACLGWLMRFPVVLFVLQTIVDSMEFGVENKKCDI